MHPHRTFSKLGAMSIVVLVMLGGSSQAQWVQTAGPNRGAVNCFVVRETTLFAGTRGGVFVSSDHGDHWTRCVSGLGDTTVRALLLSGSKLYAGIREGVFVSTDQGQSWASAGFMMSTDVHALASQGTDLFAGVHGFGGVFRSPDEGKNWNLASEGLTNPYVNALAVSGSNLLAGTQDGIFLSSNRGASWTQVLAGVNVVTLTVSDSIVYAGTEGAGLYCSTDYGAGWTATGLRQFFVGAVAIRGQAVFAGTGMGVFLSTDNGSTWTEVNAGLSDTRVTALAICGENLFAGTSQARVWRRPISEMITSVTADPGIAGIPEQFRLEQNYPNPFNATTCIRFRLPRRSLARLEVLNASGQRIATLVNRELPEGTHEAIFEATGLPSGVYLYRLEAASLKETRKAILLK